MTPSDGRPYVIVGGYMSLDGKTAPSDRDGTKFTPYLSRNLGKDLHRIRAGVDAVVIGIGTVLSYDYTKTPRLTVRLVKGKNPLRVVLDSRCRMPLDAAILDTSEAPTLVAVTDAAPRSRVAALQRMGVEVVRCGKGQVDVGRLLGVLARRGVKRVLVEGGGEVRFSFLKERLVDEFFVWVMPSVWGGRSSPTLVDGPGFTTGDEAFHMDLKRIHRKDGLIIMEFTPRGKERGATDRPVDSPSPASMRAERLRKS